MLSKTTSGHTLLHLVDARLLLPIKQSIYHSYNIRPAEERSKVFEQMVVYWAYLAIMEVK